MSTDNKSTDTNQLVHWHCEKCRIRIAVIDKEESELRLRYKDLVVKLAWSEEPGKQDRFSVLCRRCAWENTLTREQLKIGSVEQADKKC